MAMKSSSVCALEPEKITKTKWKQYCGTPCIYKKYVVVFKSASAKLSSCMLKKSVTMTKPVSRYFGLKAL